MSDEGTSSIRLHGSTYERLKELRDDGETVKDVLNRILPDDVDEVKRIDENVVGLPTSSEVTKKVNEMAGDNVSANDVIDKLIDEHEDADHE